MKADVTHSASGRGFVTLLGVESNVLAWLPTFVRRLDSLRIQWCVA